MNVLCMYLSFSKVLFFRPRFPLTELFSYFGVEIIPFAASVFIFSFCLSLACQVTPCCQQMADSVQLEYSQTLSYCQASDWEQNGTSEEDIRSTCSSSFSGLLKFLRQSQTRRILLRPRPVTVRTLKNPFTCVLWQ